MVCVAPESRGECGARTEHSHAVLAAFPVFPVPQAAATAVVRMAVSRGCGDPFQEDDIVILNGTKEEVEKLQERMMEKRAKAKASKKSKKNKPAETISKSEEVKECAASSKASSSEPKAPMENGSDSGGSSDPGPSTSTSTSKVKKPAGGPGSKRSIQDMEEKSEAYKSLFTSHSTAKRTKDQTSNW
ncbi:hypothetical protein JZ751_017972, partial [Albula glossodonta]